MSPLYTSTTSSPHAAATRNPHRYRIATLFGTPQPYRHTVWHTTTVSPHCSAHHNRIDWFGTPPPYGLLQAEMIIASNWDKKEHLFKTFHFKPESVIKASLIGPSGGDDPCKPSVKQTQPWQHDCLLSWVPQPQRPVCSANWPHARPHPIANGTRPPTLYVTKCAAQASTNSPWLCLELNLLH
jgi:hypothetical protein